MSYATADVKKICYNNHNWTMKWRLWWQLYHKVVTIFSTNYVKVFRIIKMYSKNHFGELNNPQSTYYDTWPNTLHRTEFWYLKWESHQLSTSEHVLKRWHWHSSQHVALFERLFTNYKLRLATMLYTLCMYELTHGDIKSENLLSKFAKTDIMDENRGGWNIWSHRRVKCRARPHYMYN